MFLWVLLVFHTVTRDIRLIQQFDKRGNVQSSIVHTSGTGRFSDFDMDDGRPILARGICWSDLHHYSRFVPINPETQSRLFEDLVADVVTTCPRCDKGLQLKKDISKSYHSLSNSALAEPWPYNVCDW